MNIIRGKFLRGALICALGALAGVTGQPNFQNLWMSVVGMIILICGMMWSGNQIIEFENGDEK